MNTDRIELAARAIAEACDNLKTFLLKKNAAYGNSAFEPVGVFCKADAEMLIRARLDDKISRLQRGQAAGEDTELDALGYLLLLRALPRYRELCSVELHSGIDHPTASASDAPLAVGVRLRNRALGWTAEITSQEADSYTLTRDLDRRRSTHTWTELRLFFDIDPHEARAPEPVRRFPVEATPEQARAVGALVRGGDNREASDPWQPGVEVERAGALESTKFFGLGEHGWITERRFEHDALTILVRRRRDGLVFEFSIEQMSRLFRVVERAAEAKEATS